MMETKRVYAPNNGVTGDIERIDNSPVLISLVTPAYNESRNLPILYERLCAELEMIDVEWEWIVVDDHSSDDTFSILATIAQNDRRVRVFRLTRNSGSHTAVTCGLNHALGHAAVILAADLQDPPETLPLLLAQWRAGTHVVWAARERREGETATSVGFARLYYWIMRRIVGIQEMPATGADFFLIDRCVVDALRQFNESHVSLFALITWMGFRQTTVTYDKQARLYGQSGWNLGKKLKLVIDSVTAFSYLPIRLISYLGMSVALLGFLYAIFLLGNAVLGHPVEGWTSLMVVVLLLGGIQMIMMGVLGEYLWRALDEARRRPRFLVEDRIDAQSLDSPNLELQNLTLQFANHERRVAISAD
jgi:dolichol-phosphate mannosyltransferase